MSTGEGHGESGDSKGSAAPGSQESGSQDFGTTRLTTIAVAERPVRQIDTSVVVGETLAHGGMGAVHEARQQSLERTVAVKRASGRYLGRLLEEARITGYLEHPNIVPVHEIAFDADHEPLVVLKRIEGESWREAISEPARLDGSDGAGSLFWHIRVALRVCQALRFAHSRQILHRDVKPSNVMIGSFDEVYLLDWGLAVSMDQDDLRFPRLSEAVGTSGTPAYMAPEQFQGRPHKIGTHTDVYLVAASLFHAIAGHPPQRGRRLEAMRARLSARKDLKLPSKTPFELVEVLERAMAIRVEDRTQTVDQLYAELQAFIAHQGASKLVSRGDRFRDQMSDFFQRGEPHGVERAFFDATTSYRAALEAWPENPQARARLHDVVVERVLQLLNDAAPQAAQRALSLLEQPPADLAQRVTEALDQDARSRERLQQFDHGENRVIGLRARRVLALTLGSVWLAWWAWLAADPDSSPRSVTIGTCVAAVLGALGFFRYRRIMFGVRLNRYNVSIGTATLVLQLLAAVVAWRTGRSFEQLVEPLLLLWALGAASAAVVVDRGVIASAAIAAVLYTGSAFYPGLLRWSPLFASVGFLVVSLGINVTRAWSSRHDGEGAT